MCVFAADVIQSECVCVYLLRPSSNQSVCVCCGRHPIRVFVCICCGCHLIRVCVCICCGRHLIRVCVFAADVVQSECVCVFAADINECLMADLLGVGLCGPRATCTNEAGSCHCHCPTGYETPPNNTCAPCQGQLAPQSISAHYTCICQCYNNNTCRCSVVSIMNIECNWALFSPLWHYNYYYCYYYYYYYLCTYHV